MFSTFWLAQTWASNLLSGLIGAVVGGVISFFASWCATKNAAKTAFEVQQREFENRRRAERDAALEVIRGTVQSISDEAEGLWKHYGREIGLQFAALPDGHAAPIVPISQNYFVIFDAAAAQVGRIPNQTLRSKIIEFYLSAKGLVDSLKHYEGLRASYEMIAEHDQKIEKWQEIIQYSRQLRTMTDELSKLYPELESELESFLHSKG
jgi:hypothetical protein